MRRQCCTGRHTKVQREAAITANGIACGRRVCRRGRGWRRSMRPCDGHAERGLQGESIHYTRSMPR